MTAHRSARLAPAMVLAMLLVVTAARPPAAADQALAGGDPGADPPSVAALARVCPGPLPAPPFVDVDPEATHGRAIACLVDLGVTAGATSDAYQPGTEVTRGQLATFLARMLRASGEVLDVPEDGRFSDLEGSVHAPSAEALAAIGIVRGTASDRFDPGHPVRRDQLASLLVRLAEHLDDGASPLPPPVGDDQVAAMSFADVPEANVHRDAIARLATTGVVQGTSATTYAPAAGVTRAQLASFLLRTGELVADNGRLLAPSAPRAPLVPATTRVLTDTQRRLVTDVHADGTLAFVTVPNSLAVGDVVVAEPFALAPTGLLRRITAIDGWRVRTEPAALTDAVHAGRDRVERPLTRDLVVAEQVVAEGVRVASSAAGGLRLDLEPGVSLADGVRVSGHVVLDLTAVVEVALAPRHPFTATDPQTPTAVTAAGPAADVAAVGTQLEGNQTTRLHVEVASRASAAARELPDDTVIYTAEFAPLVLRPGGVPAVVVPTLTVSLTGDGQVVAGTMVDVVQSAETSTHLRHTVAGGWTLWGGVDERPEVAGFDLDVIEDPATAPEGASQAGLGAAVKLGARWFDHELATITMTPALHLDVDPARVPSWRLGAGIAIGAAAQGEPVLGTPATELSLLDRELALIEAPPPPPPPIRVGEGWYRAPGRSAVFGTSGRLVRYTVEIADGLRSRQDLEEFTEFVDEHLGDPRHGWTARGTVRMQRVQDASQARIRVLLATPRTVDRLCGQVGLRTGGYYSCWTGRFAVLNADRWFHSVPHVPDLTLYRGYLVNHEVGHGLGFGHRPCPGPGRIAPVMMQLSKSTYGCVPNPYPYRS